MKEVKIGVVKRCPRCNWRVLDKIGATSGVIEMKCPNCHRTIRINLSLRKSVGVKYRMASNL